MVPGKSLCVSLVAIGALMLAAPAAAEHGNADDATPNMVHHFNSPRQDTSDLAFWRGAPVTGPFQDLAFVGNYNGFRIFDISTPWLPRLVSDVRCPSVQGDPSVYRAHNRLIFIQSVDQAVTDPDCATGTNIPPGYTGPRWEGLRVFDVTNPLAPVHIASVRTTCGSHTHTTIPDDDDQRLIVYVSSNPGGAGTPFCPQPHAKISIVEIPYANPAAARVLKEQPLHFDTPEYFFGTRSLGVACHEITAFLHPTRSIAFASCQSEGQFWDISDPANPTTLTAHTHVRNPAIQYWHSSTFTWDGEVLAVSDETALGRCDGGATLAGNMWFYKVVPPGTPEAPLLGMYSPNRPHPGSCHPHQANVIPTNVGYIGVSSFWRGGTSVFDFTNPAAAREIAYFDPSGADGRGEAETWSSYWYNDYIYASDFVRGFDVFQLFDENGQPFRSRQFTHMNPQTQETAAFRPDVTPPSCVVVSIGANQVIVVARDVESGLGSITPIAPTTNVLVRGNTGFAAGTQAQVTVTGTRVNRARPLVLRLRVTDVAGHSTTCDPVLATLRVNRADRPTVRSYAGIPRLEHKLTIKALRPGLKKAVIIANGQRFVVNLRGKRIARLSIARALTHGRNNTVTIKLYGARGAVALVALTD